MDRLKADSEFRQCLQPIDPLIADIYFEGVRSGGSSEEFGMRSLLPWRWGYGWINRPAYRKLNSSEVQNVRASMSHRSLVYIQDNIQEDVVLSGDQLRYIQVEFLKIRELLF